MIPDIDHANKRCLAFIRARERVSSKWTPVTFTGHCFFDTLLIYMFAVSDFSRRGDLYLAMYIHFAVYDFYLFLLHSLPPPLSLSLCFFLSLTRSLAPIFPHCISLIIVADCAVNTAIVKYSITAHWHPSRLQVDRFVFLYRTRWSNFLRKKSQYRLHLRVATPTCDSYAVFR